jgi:5-methylcytosine-specific restriction protein A
MKIPPITKQNVLDALRDLDDGVSEPKFGKARKYQVKHDGKSYAPKPVVAHAVKHLTGTALGPYDFSSGEATGHAVAVLRDLGFEVTEKTSERNPKWTTDEIILALDFYLEHRKSIPNKTDASVVALSEDLRALNQALGGELTNTFRNINGTYLKLMNLRRLDPDYEGTGLQAGGKLEEELWDRYFNKPQELGLSDHLKTGHM